MLYLYSCIWKKLYNIIAYNWTNMRSLISTKLHLSGAHSWMHVRHEFSSPHYRAQGGKQQDTLSSWKRTSYWGARRTDDLWVDGTRAIDSHPTEIISHWAVMEKLQNRWLDIYCAKWGAACDVKRAVVWLIAYKWPIAVLNTSSSSENMTN